MCRAIAKDGWGNLRIINGLEMPKIRILLHIGKLVRVGTPCV
jgi:hypothetical protein